MARLGLVLLNPVSNVNSFQEVSELYLNSGESGILYFRIVDLDTGLRFLPSAAGTLAVKFKHLDANKVINRSASMTYPLDDRSVWSVTLSATDSLLPDSMEATLTDGITVRRLRLEGSLRFTVSGDEGYYC